MDVKEAGHLAGVRAGGVVCLTALALACTLANAQVQPPNPSSATNPYYGSVTVRSISG